MTESRFIDQNAPPSGTGCAECDTHGGWWFHLRRCALCGHIGCCDNSPGQHATKHFQETGHRIMQSFEPGESWFWDYGTAAESTGPQLASPTHHPPHQGVPGPRERVPKNWQELLIP